jgi:hypothetical protein
LKKKPIKFWKNRNRNRKNLKKTEPKPEKIEPKPEKLSQTSLNRFLP